MKIRPPPYPDASRCRVSGSSRRRCTGDATCFLSVGLRLVAGTAQSLQVLIVVGSALGLRDDVVTPRRVGFVTNRRQNSVAQALLAQSVVTLKNPLSCLLP